MSLTINSVRRPELAELAYQNTDMMVNLIYNKMLPPMGSDTEVGTFRAGDPLVNFQELGAFMDKYSLAKEFNYSDSFQNFALTAEGAAFKFSEGDLQQPGIYGARTRQDLINSRVITYSNLLKKLKEKALYTAVSTNTNFQSSSYYANANVAWSTHATADPIGDVVAGKLVVPEANALAIPYSAFLDLQQVAALKSESSVQGKKRDVSVDPTITSEWLKNVFQVDYIFISRGRLITDSSDPTDATKTSIWGRKALLFYHNPNTSDIDGRWMKYMYWALDGASSDEGWIVTENNDPEIGLVGVTRWQIGNYTSFVTQRKDLAYRIDAI